MCCGEEIFGDPEKFSYSLVRLCFPCWEKIIKAVENNSILQKLAGSKEYNVIGQARTILRYYLSDHLNTLQTIAVWVVYDWTTIVEMDLF